MRVIAKVKTSVGLLDSFSISGTRELSQVKLWLFVGFIEKLVAKRSGYFHIQLHFGVIPENFEDETNEGTCPFASRDPSTSPSKSLRTSHQICTRTVGKLDFVLGS